jgi:hypothetical protein
VLLDKNTSVKDTPNKLSRLSTYPLENTTHVMFQGPKKFYVKTPAFKKIRLGRKKKPNFELVYAIEKKISTKSAVP